LGNVLEGNVTGRRSKFTSPNEQPTIW
jgi:hypothetical protein